MFEALRELGRLSPAQRAILANKRFSGVFTPEALLSQMRTLAAFDRSGDSGRKRAGGWAIAAAGQVVLGLFASIWFGKAAVAYALLMLVVAVALAIVWQRLRMVDISNNFAETALPFLAIVKQDMEPDQTLDVDIDLSPAVRRSKRGSVSKPYKRGAYTKIVDTIFHDPWFSGTARLADSSVLRWRVTDEVRRSKRTKRNPRGKYKFSTRHAKRSLVEIALSLPNRTYSVQDSRQRVARLAVATGDKRSTIRLGRKVKSRSLDPVDPRELIDLVSEAYGRAGPAGSRP
jgi:hypothetical protein